MQNSSHNVCWLYPIEVFDFGFSRVFLRGWYLNNKVINNNYYKVCFGDSDSLKFIHCCCKNIERTVKKILHEHLLHRFVWWKKDDHLDKTGKLSFGASVIHNFYTSHIHGCSNTALFKTHSLTKGIKKWAKYIVELCKYAGIFKNITLLALLECS